MKEPRLLDRKLTPMVFVLFFLALAAMSAAAAGIGYLTQHLSRPQTTH